MASPTAAFLIVSTFNKKRQKMIYFATVMISMHYGRFTFGSVLLNWALCCVSCFLAAFCFLDSGVLIFKPQNSNAQKKKKKKSTKTQICYHLVAKIRFEFSNPPSKKGSISMIDKVHVQLFT